jgi:hypothetical protein
MGALSAMAAPVSADDFAVMLASFRVATSDAEEISISLSDVFVALMQQAEHSHRIVVVRQRRDYIPLAIHDPANARKAAKGQRTSRLTPSQLLGSFRFTEAAIDISAFRLLCPRV